MQLQHILAQQCARTKTYSWAATHPALRQQPASAAQPDAAAKAAFPPESWFFSDFFWLTSASRNGFHSVCIRRLGALSIRDFHGCTVFWTSQSLLETLKWRGCSAVVQSTATQVLEDFKLALGYLHFLHNDADIEAWTSCSVSFQETV